MKPVVAERVSTILNALAAQSQLTTLNMSALRLSFDSWSQCNSANAVTFTNRNTNTALFVELWPLSRHRRIPIVITGKLASSIVPTVATAHSAPSKSDVLSSYHLLYF